MSWLIHTDDIRMIYVQGDDFDAYMEKKRCVERANKSLWVSCNDMCKICPNMTHDQWVR